MIYFEATITRSILTSHDHNGQKLHMTNTLIHDSHDSKMRQGVSIIGNMI